MHQNIYLTSLTEPEKQTLLNAWKDVMSIADSHQHASDELRKLVSQFPIAAVEKVASNLDIPMNATQKPMLHWLTLKDEILKTLAKLKRATNIELAAEILRQAGVPNTDAIAHRQMQKRIPPILKRLVRDKIVIRFTDEIDKSKTTFLSSSDVGL